MGDTQSRLYLAEECSAGTESRWDGGGPFSSGVGRLGTARCEGFH